MMIAGCCQLGYAVDRISLHTLLVFPFLVFVPAIVERYCDSELCFGNVCGGVSKRSAICRVGLCHL